MTFRYSENLANGEGFVFNPGEQPVEGYSNFLWMLILVAVDLAGLPVYPTAKWLGVISFLLSGVLFFLFADRYWHKSARLAAAALIACPLTAFWAVSGLELGLYSLLLTAIIILLFIRSKWTAAVIPFLIITRPESPGLVLVVLMMAAFIERKNKSIDKTYLIIGFAVWLAGTAALLSFRQMVFGYLMPNTFYAKSSFNLPAVYELIRELHFFLPHIVLFIIGVIKLIKNAKDYGLGLIMAGAFVIQAAISIFADPVMNFKLRYLVAFFPFFFAVAFYVLSEMKDKKAAKIILAVSFIFLISPLAETYTKIQKEKKIIAAQKDLIEFINHQPPGIWISLTDIGRVPYYTRANYNDIWGLVSSDIAHKGFNPLMEYSRLPNYFVFAGTKFGDKLMLRFGRERLINKVVGFPLTYEYIKTAAPENKDLEIDGYYYLIFKRNDRAVDSLLQSISIILPKEEYRIFM